MFPFSCATSSPIGGVLVAYTQMGWFAQPRTNFALEEAWVRWDRLILDDWGVSEAIEALGPVVPGTLEFLYLLTYAVAPIGLLLLYSKGLLGRADQFLAIYVAVGGPCLRSVSVLPIRTSPNGVPRRSFRTLRDDVQAIQLVGPRGSRDPHQRIPERTRLLGVRRRIRTAACRARTQALGGAR